MMWSYTPSVLRVVDSIPSARCSSYIMLHNKEQFSLETDDKLENVPLQHCYFSGISTPEEFENFVNTVNRSYLSRSDGIGIVNHSDKDSLTAEVLFSYYLYEFYGDVIRAEEKLGYFYAPMVSEHFRKSVLPNIVHLYGFHDESDEDKM